MTLRVWEQEALQAARRQQETAEKAKYAVRSGD